MAPFRDAVAYHLSAIGPHYQLAQGINADLAAHVVDRDMADELRCGAKSIGR
jgi:hypothetical protein